MTMFRFTLNGKTAEGGNADLENLYNQCRGELNTAKSIADLKRVHDRVRNLYEASKRLVVVDTRMAPVGEAFKAAHLKAFECLLKDVERELKERELKEEGIEAVKKMLEEAQKMLRLKKKTSLVAILRAVKSVCGDFGIDIPSHYEYLQIQSTNI